MRRVLFVSAHNSVRSQMAEGLLRYAAGDRYEALSAGIRPAEMDPLMVEVMGEIGIDVSHQQAKGMERFLNVSLAAVVTLCDDARVFCPKFPGGSRFVYWKFQDPATIIGSRRERLAMLRLLRDEIAARVEQEFGLPSPLASVHEPASLLHPPA